MLDTDQLRSFLAIVDTGSFTRAARHVNKTQSAVSMHIRRLEERLDRNLFVKDGRRAKLSSDGERLVDHARRMLRVEAEALHDLKAGGLAGRVALGIPDDYADSFLPQIVGRFTRLHPLVELAISCRPSLNLAVEVSSGELDLAVVTSCDQIRGVEELREEPLRWVAGLRTGDIEHRRPVPLIVSTLGCAWRGAALDALHKAEVPWRIFMVSSNYAAIAPIVQSGLALTVLPHAVVDTATQRIVMTDGGLPPLPTMKVGLLVGPTAQTREAEAMADVIRMSLTSSAFS